MHVDRTGMELSILYSNGSQDYDALITVLKTANSADPDEMLHHAAFHLGLHCLPKYLFTISRMKGFR